MSELRESNLTKLQQQVFDVIIVGGGINGAVAAAALAAKGAKVALLEKGDFASGTSSQSSNLAWGGIKYLESREFSLVSALCKSRNHLMRHYPSTVKEMRFLTSIQRGFRYPPFVVYLGTLLYWLIGRCFTRLPNYLRPRQLKAREAILNTRAVSGGFEYSDAYLHDNDARFVFNFVRSAMSYGCIAVNYVACQQAAREQGQWQLQVQDKISHNNLAVQGRVLINAAGPHVDALNQQWGTQTAYRHVFSKGVHLIVDKLTDSNKVLTFFASDGRLFFVIPMGPKTCIGTTDTQVNQPQVRVSDEDRQFILNNANQLLDLPRRLTRKDIIAERCGVRPLAIRGQGKADWVQLSRKHVLEVSAERAQLSVFGGKLTDCINVGEQICDKVRELGVELPFAGQKWYGEPDITVRQEFMHRAQLMGLDTLTPATSSEPLSQRFWRRYGRNALNMLEQIRENPRMGELLIENSEYLRVELEHAARREMVTKLEDFLRRRSKISQVVRQQDILAAPGLFEACQILFGEQAETKLQEYTESLE